MPRGCQGSGEAAPEGMAMAAPPAARAPQVSSASPGPPAAPGGGARRGSDSGSSRLSDSLPAREECVRSWGQM